MADERLLASVRGGMPGTITFFVGDLTVMVNVTRTGERQRIDGWLVPAGEHGVEVRVADHGSTKTTADEGGRFVLTEVPRGTRNMAGVLPDAAPRCFAEMAEIDRGHHHEALYWALPRTGQGKQPPCRHCQ